ncbi:MAG: hypothetical protein P9M14_06250 [Candidatus Alcyoniella australis]|nr:hypothetical protein [Candidatus Alcyoniella australis]
MDPNTLQLLAIVAGAMAGYGAMFTFLIRWITRKNDELIKIMLGNDRAWKNRTAECLDEIRDHVEHGECCGYRADQANIHERLAEIRAAVVERKTA